MNNRDWHTELPDPISAISHQSNLHVQELIERFEHATDGALSTNSEPGVAVQKVRPQRVVQIKTHVKSSKQSRICFHPTVHGGNADVSRTEVVALKDTY